MEYVEKQAGLISLQMEIDQEAVKVLNLMLDVIRSRTDKKITVRVFNAINEKLRELYGFQLVDRWNNGEMRKEEYNNVSAWYSRSEFGGQPTVSVRLDPAIKELREREAAFNITPYTSTRLDKSINVTVWSGDTLPALEQAIEHCRIGYRTRLLAMEKTTPLKIAQDFNRCNQIIRDQQEIKSTLEYHWLITE